MMSNKYYDYRPTRSSRLSKTWNQNELPVSLPSTLAVNYSGVTTHVPNASANAAFQPSLSELDPSMNTPFNSPVSALNTRGNGGAFARRHNPAKSTPLRVLPRHNTLPNRPLGHTGHVGYGGAPQQHQQHQHQHQQQPQQQPQQPAPIAQGTLPEMAREFGTNEIAVRLYHDNQVLFQMYIACQTVHGITNCYSSPELGWAPEAIEDYRFSYRVLAARHDINKAFTEVEVAHHNPYLAPEERHEMERQALSWLDQGRRHHKHTFLAASYQLTSPSARHEQLQWGKTSNFAGQGSPAPICSRAIVRFVEDMSICSSIDEAKRHAFQGDWTWRSRC